MARLITRRGCLTTLGVFAGVIAIGWGLVSWFAPMSAGPAVKNEVCAHFPKVSLALTHSKRDLEDSLSIIIASVHSRFGHINWDEFSNCFRSSGRSYQVMVLPNDGAVTPEVARFTIDRSGIWPFFLNVPGGSNGKFTAVFRIVSEDEVVVIRRGGEPEQLQLQLLEN